MDYSSLHLHLELEGIRASLIQALLARHKELEAEISKQLTAICAAFDFEQAIRAEVDRVLPGLVRDAVLSSLRNALWSEPVKSELNAIVQRAALNFLKKAGETTYGHG